MTSFDVARLAGVSQPTVSRALRNLPGASAETRQRVLHCAATLSYIPSDSGRALSTRNTRRVAVVSEELTNPFYPELLHPLTRLLDAQGLRTVLLSAAQPAEIGVDALSDGSYDGVVLTTTTRRSSLPRDLTERGIPHVLVNRVLDVPESPACAFDNAAGAQAVAALLDDLGHRQVALVQGPTATSTGRERANGVRTALRARGVVVPRTFVRRTDFTHDAGFAAATELFRLHPRPTAVVCGNDVIALGVLSAARNCGLRVPRDVTVIGFDDIPAAAWPLVDLTTVRCDLGNLARTAVDLLTASIAGREVAPRLHTLPVLLVPRGTHAPPR